MLKPIFIAPRINKMCGSDVHTVLKLHLPEKAVPYCFDLWRRNNFTLRIKRSRRSKLGDYRFDPQNNTHSISVNNDLNRYAFLITYLHEVAHLFTFREYGKKVKPHGRQWKLHFRLLMQPILSEKVFPRDIHEAVSEYMVNPAATSCSDPGMMEILNEYDVLKSLFLKDVPSGSIFRFHDREFIKGELRRTRYVCEEKRSGKKYLISGLAGIHPV